MSLGRYRYRVAILGFVAAVPFAGTALALDFSPDTTRYLSDPSFLPKHGQLEGTTTYQYDDFSDDVNNASGAKFVSQTQKTSSINQDLAFGLSDRLAIRGSIGYAASRLSDDYTTGQTYKFDSNGGSDPWLAVSYRLIEQKASPVSIDAFIEYSPDLFDAKSGTTGQSGTVARGGQAGEAVLHVNREMKSLTLQLEAGVQQNDSRKILNLSDGTDTKVGALTAYLIGLRTQTRLNNAFAVNLGTVYRINGSSSVSNAANHMSYTSDNGNSLVSYVGLNYSIIPQKFSVEAEYQYTATGKTSVDNAVNYSVGSWSNPSANSAVLSLHYLFF